MLVIERKEELSTYLATQRQAGKKIDTIDKDKDYLDSYYNLYNELAG